MADGNRSLKIAVVAPDNSRFPKYDWVFGALAMLGHDCRFVRDIGSLAKADAESDLVLFAHKSAGLNQTDLVALSRSKKAKWVQWWFDLVATERDVPLVDQPTIRGHGDTMRAMDLVCVKEADLLGEYSSIGINARWLDQGCPYWLARTKAEGPKRYDFAVFGQAGRAYQERCEDVRRLAGAGYSVAWYGHAGTGVPVIDGCTFRPWVFPDQMPMVASESKVFLSVDFRHDVRGYWSDRLWLGLGMGACVMKRECDGLPGLKIGIGGCESLSADSLPAALYGDGDLLGWADHLCGKDSAGRRTAMGDAAYRYVRAGHTYKERCLELLGLAWGSNEPKANEGGDA